MHAAELEDWFQVHAVNINSLSNTRKVTLMSNNDGLDLYDENICRAVVYVLDTMLFPGQSRSLCTASVGDDLKPQCRK